MNLEFLRNKKIAIVGLGAEGRALLDFFVRHKLTADVFDKRELSGADLPDSAGKIISGPDYLGSLKNYDIIFRSPGTSPLLPEIVEAKIAGVDISSLTKLFFRLCPCPIIGVTGTKGKGTTATLVHQIFLADKRKTFLGGNIGKTSLEFLPELDEKSFVVLELSSFQLADLEASPKFAVVLNITPDHQDYHKDTREYISAKTNLVRHQKITDIAVLNADYETSKSFAAATPAKKFWFSTKATTEPGAFYSDGALYLKLKSEEVKLCDTDELALLGPHNLENILAAALTAAVVGVKAKVISRAIKAYRGMAHHRLEFVAEVGKVEYYNDSASTTPAAAIAAIRTFSKPKIIILGGSEKGADFSSLAGEISRQNVTGVILSGETAEKIEKALIDAGFNGKIIKGVNNMEEIVKTAVSLAEAGSVVVLSPASASFGQFENYQDRGEQFIKAVRKIK
mgnify:FL=1